MIWQMFSEKQLKISMTSAAFLVAESLISVVK